MFDPQRFLQSLRARPEDERVLFAFVGALVVAGIIFLVWVSIFFYTMRHGSRAAQPVQEITPEVNTLSETVNAVLNDDSENYDPLPSDSQTEELPLELVDTPPDASVTPATDTGTYTDY